MANGGRPKKGRVTITYDGGGDPNHRVELRPTIGLLGAYSGHTADADRTHEWVDLDAKNLAQLGGLRVRFAANVPNVLTGEGDLAVDIDLSGHAPNRWVEVVQDRVEPIRRLRELRAAVNDLGSKIVTDGDLRTGIARLLALPESQRTPIVATFEACDREK